MNNITNEIWKSQRYRLITRYCNAPLLPVPFNLVEIGYQYRQGKLKEYFYETDALSAILKKISDERKYEISLLEKKYSSEYLYGRKCNERETIESKLKLTTERYLKAH